MGPLRFLETEFQSPGQVLQAFHNPGQGDRPDLAFPDFDRPGGEMLLAQGMEIPRVSLKTLAES
jgi:hypothetical protein